MSRRIVVLLAALAVLAVLLVPLSASALQPKWYPSIQASGNTARPGQVMTYYYQVTGQGVNRLTVKLTLPAQMAMANKGIPPYRMVNGVRTWTFYNINSRTVQRTFTFKTKVKLTAKPGNKLTVTLSQHAQAGAWYEDAPLSHVTRIPRR